MRTIVLLALIAAAPAGAATRGYALSDFDRVRVNGATQVTIVKGRATSVSAEGSLDSLDRLALQVIDRELIVQQKAPLAGERAKRGETPATVRVTVPGLRALRLIGSGRIDADSIGGASTSLSVSGSGAINVTALEADRATLGLTGAGSIAAGGKAKMLSAVLLGSGSIDAATLIADDLTVNASTTGKATLGARRSAKVTSNGSGDVIVTGTPACTVRNTGAGTVRCGR